jgi:hypothetical protein
MALDKEIIINGEINGISSFSGKKERCPNCGREVDEGFCAVHAEVDPEKDFNMTVKVDTAKVKLDKDAFEKVTGFKSEEIDALPENEKMNLLKKKLYGLKVRVVGNKGEKHFYPNEIDVIEE